MLWEIEGTQELIPEVLHILFLAFQKSFHPFREINSKHYRTCFCTTISLHSFWQINTYTKTNKRIKKHNLRPTKPVPTKFS